MPISADVTIVDFSGGADVTSDPAFLGEPPSFSANVCSHCSRWRDEHELDGVPVTARAFHRFDFSPAGGYYTDELEAFQK
jgi:hypothetical protein